MTTPHGIKRSTRNASLLVAGVVLLLGFAGTLTAAPSAPPSVLASYSFDETSLDAGPDTFRVFQYAKGTVTISSAYRVSGYSSVEIRDVAGDHDFPELQGYFPALADGVVYFHFAFLTTDVSQPFNIALAGPKWFNLKKDAIAFWLEVEDGWLRHVSNAAHGELLAIDPFTWYVVDVDYDITRGTYALLIYQEGFASPVVSLREQTNANGHAKSVVDKFSFIGDRGEDTSNAIYYVDDVIITTDKQIVPPPLVAPGRRKLFIDYHNEYRLDRLLNPRCLPVAQMSDVGLNARDLQELARDGRLSELIRLFGNDFASEKQLAQYANGDRRLYAVASWRAGCVAMEAGDMQAALRHFEEAQALAASGKMYPLSRALALAGLKSWPEVNNQLAWIYADWSDDLRFAAALAMIGLARGDLEQARSLLEGPATALIGDMSADTSQAVWDGNLDASALKELEGSDDKSWQQYLARRLISEQYFYVLLWRERYQEAEDYAAGMVAQFKNLDWSGARWLERAGDAAVFNKKLQRALYWYGNSLNVHDNAESVLLKLSDVHFLLGDLQRERSRHDGGGSLPRDSAQQNGLRCDIRQHDRR